MVEQPQNVPSSPSSILNRPFMNRTRMILRSMSWNDRMSTPPIPVPTPTTRHSAHETLSHSHPNDSAGTRPVLSPSAANKNPGDDKKPRRTSLQVLLPKLPSSESLNYSPSSPGIVNWLDNNSKSDQPSPDKLQTPDTDKLTRKESYKAQRKNYCREKKRVANELLNTIKDTSVVVLADWLKVRGTLKSWTKLWCILKPGLLLLYKSPKAKSNHWVGTVLLNTCQIIERPSKKDGFCFKLFHPLEQSIWSPRGPEKETIGAVVQPLPTAYLIFRAPSQAAGKCWMDALELSLRCSSLLVRSSSSKSSGPQDATANHETQWSEADYEKHFTDHDLDDISQPDIGGACDHLSGAEQASLSESESETSIKKEGLHDTDGEPLETPYVHLGEVEEEFGSAGEQVEELAEEHKSLIWYLVKQVRPGMDLSKVVLPTFILEPRSFLDKLSDSYYHADILANAVLEDDAFTRMKGIVKWYLSGFYKKPKGLKKPYNPILGETFRCYWKHPNGSRTFYLAEQVSHHPPVSAFYRVFWNFVVVNYQPQQKDTFFRIAAQPHVLLIVFIFCKRKFCILSGNSTSAILDGVALLTLLPRGEDYSITIPYAHCKGILMGTLTMELGGKVIIDCEKTGYKTEIEFKLKEEQLFWKPTTEIRSQRLKRFTVSLDHQGEFESEHLWQHVAATEEKTVLEEAQRAAAKERKMKCLEWIPKYFEQDLISGQWVYKHADLRPWDPRNDVYQYEYNYVIQTKTRHQTPMIRTASIVSVDPQTVVPLLQTESRSSISALKSSKHHLASKVMPVERQDSASSSPDGEFHSDSSQSIENESRSRTFTCRTHPRLTESITRLEAAVKENGEKLNRIHKGLEHLAKVQREKGAEKSFVSSFGLSFTQELVLTVVLVVNFLKENETSILVFAIILKCSL
ncbi:Oxysterol-binding protein-related protein 8 [Blattella germanica]|nr:Oxysterol-binding protein-related protein 8 [Blattella germanica]